MRNLLRGIIFFLMLPIGSHCAAQVQAAPTVAEPSANEVTVPFVGCEADGQAGPKDAPKATTKRVHISRKAADQLAYYKAEDGFGVLGPRGRHCFETYGSNGGSLYVSPEPLDPATLLSDKWKGFPGPAIQLSTEVGGTSGAYGVAQTIARIFPSHKAFVRKVIEEGFGSASDFPFGPYPNDKLTYKSSDVVEYQTPGKMDGLGTQSRLQNNADPIRGVVLLVGPREWPNIISLHIRLPAELTDLAPAIIRQTEQETASKN
jgi:hypothetical protein